MRFLWGDIKITSKMTILAYISTYYAIVAAVLLTLANYLIVGWFSFEVDQFFLTSWMIFDGMADVFNILVSSPIPVPLPFITSPVTPRLRNAPSPTGRENFLLGHRRHHKIDTHVRALLRRSFHPSLRRAALSFPLHQDGMDDYSQGSRETGFPRWSR